jgi:Tol biopolymer transport system component
LPPRLPLQRRLAGSRFSDWSPDGERIVFTRAEPFGSTESIWIVNADGTGLVQVTDGEDDNPDWETPPSTT